MKDYFVYILASRKNGTLYVGVTNDIERRMYEHKSKFTRGFTQKYSVNKLVYIEMFTEVYDAIYREKQLKKWKRQWKIDLIKRNNPDWNDLFLL
ncbi:GIY-YIG nuclease family protein [Candidatus Uabimicrobium sp. HlEnr_7]|uniref:GIY-YIG nuclease family protein n=1 Tax=Candidatus Uabimicrobium helgolandensis TaxID=3095367 RepID=UPI0035589151